VTDLPARLRSAEAGQGALRGLWLTFLSPFGLEVASGCGADWIGVDLQHGDLEVTDLAPLIRTSTLPVLARTASHDPHHLARVLDTGVDGVIVPAVESGSQAAELAAAVATPPVGRRSTGAGRTSVVGGPASPLLLPMVETRAGLEAVEEILATPGVDGVFVGPYDLSLSLGLSSVLCPELLAAATDVIDAARACGRLAGAFAGHAELAAQLPPLDLLGVDSDAGALRAGLALLFGDESTGRGRPARDPAP